MADSLSPQKKHHNVFTFTSILFFISLFLILLILLRDEHTFNVFISSSINPDLFSQTNTTNSPSPVLQSQSIAPQFNHTPEIESPISAGESIDAIINGEKRKNETETTPFEKNENLVFVNGSVSVNGSFENEVEEAKKLGKSCNLYMGKWVRDDGYPIYRPGSCPFVDEAYDCQNNGRPDFDFMKWRWKPDDCDHPRKSYFKEGDYLYPRFDAVEAYSRALKTWGEWIDKNLNPARQLVFYRAYSSAHFRGGDWDSGGTCNGEKEPIYGGTFLDSYPMKMKIVEDAIQHMKFPVILLNVTRLTNFRKDGHPSVYSRMRTKGGMKISTRKQDCSHWCLPGVPDAWNELIYATLIYQQTAVSQAL